MRRFLIMVALVACGFATPAHAQDGQSSCMAQMAAVVGPLLQQASQFSPQGVAGQGFVPLTQPFAPPAYALPYGIPAPPSLAPPTGMFNASAGFTSQVGLQPQFLPSGALINFLARTGRLNLTNPQAADANLLIQLANLQQTEQARQQQQALLQQQQGLYLNSLYQLSSSYQITSLDWSQAYSTLAQAWMSYFRDLCGRGGDGGAGLGAATGAVGTPTQNQPFPQFPAGPPLTPGFPR
jgi:hypothetical protein